MLRAAFVARSVSAAPIVTWCAGQQRAELSGRSYANGVAKAANYLADDIGLDAGALVAVRLGSHWQSAIWHAAALIAGATLTDLDAADVLVAFPDEPADTVAQRLALSRHPMGLPDRDLPSGWRNAAAEVSGAPDVLLVPAVSADVVWRGTDAVIAAADLASMAAAVVPDGDGRLALVGTPRGRDALVCHAAVPLLLGIPVLLTAEASTGLFAAEKIERSLTFPVS